MNVFCIRDDPVRLLLHVWRTFKVLSEMYELLVIQRVIQPTPSQLTD